MSSSQFVHLLILCFRNFLLDACGSSSNEDRITLLCSLLKKEDVLSIIRAPQSKVISEAVTNEVMKKFSNLVSDIDIQSACDEAGISTKGYETIHRLLKDALRKNGITENVFPVPKKVRFSKKVSDDDIIAKLQSYKYVEDTMVIPSQKKKGGSKKQARGQKATTVSTSEVTEDKGFAYTKFNNIFVDLKKLQQAMILFYKLPQEGKYIFSCFCLSTLISIQL